MPKIFQKHIALSCVFLAFIYSGFSQQEARNTLTMFSQSLSNPAIPGNKDQGDMYLVIRQPQMGFRDAEGNKIGLNNRWLAATVPLKKINSGVGLNVHNEKNGLFETSNNLTIQYAYQFTVGDGRLGAGISGTIKFTKFDFSEAVYPSSVDDKSGTDPLVQRLGMKGTTAIAIGAGLNYSINDLTFGVSILNANSPKIKTEQGKLSYYVPHLYIFAGYSYYTSNPLFTLLPSLQYKGQLGKPITISASQINFNSLVEYNKFLVFGLSYCTSNDISFIAGATIRNGSKLDGMRFVASWDIITSKLRKTSLELTIGYNFNMTMQKTVKTYKSVRFL